MATKPATVKPTVIAQSAKKQVTPKVSPVLRFNDADHALETALKGKEAPEIKSIGIVKLETGWISCTIISKGENVLEIIPGEPNMKKIAIDEAKVCFVDNFMNDF